MRESNKQEHFRDIYERHVNDIYRLCFSYLRNAHDSEDAVSAVFCKLMKKNPDFESPEHEKSWLVVVACNECKSMLRARSRHPKFSIDELPEQAVSENFRRVEIFEAIFSMSEKYSTIVYLHLYMGYSLVEIAKMTKQKESTVRSQLFYAKKKLAKILGDMGGIDDE